MRKTLIAFLVMTLALVFTAAPAAFAAENTTDNYETTYTVKVYPGLKGTLDTTEYKGHHYGEAFKGNLSANDVEVNNSRYYAKGFRLTGHDNSEYVTSLSDFAVTKDLSYEVAYGVKGKMVSYTAKYVDGNGKPLAPEDTFYGNIDDKPTVAYKYVDGYMPASYTMGKTLKENEADNVFEFIYTKTAKQTPAPVNPAAPGNANNANAAANGGNGGNGGAAGGGGAGVGANNGAGANNAGAGNTATIGIDEILRKAILMKASGILVAHNHPSDDVTPSFADRELTHKLSQACRMISIPLVDHIIVGKSSYFSFKNHSMLE